MKQRSVQSVYRCTPLPSVHSLPFVVMFSFYCFHVHSALCDIFLVVFFIFFPGVLVQLLQTTSYFRRCCESMLCNVEFSCPHYVGCLVSLFWFASLSDTHTESQALPRPRPSEAPQKKASNNTNIRMIVSTRRAMMHVRRRWLEMKASRVRLRASLRCVKHAGPPRIH